jgi:hypothetical protein
MKNKLSNEQIKQLQKKQLDDGDLNKFFKIVTDGVDDTNKEEYEFLRRKSVNLGDVYEFYAGLGMQNEKFLNHINKELTILEYIIDDTVPKEKIEAAVEKYKEYYSRISDALDKEVSKQQEDKK